MSVGVARQAIEPPKPRAHLEVQQVQRSLTRPQAQQVTRYGNFVRTLT